MYVVHWKTGNTEGHGQPMEFIAAYEWCLLLCKQHGKGTHWIKKEGE